MKAKWSVLALYENADARQLAVQFCDGLIERFWAESGFDLSWCDWTELEQPASANEAATRVRGADLIVVAPASGAVMPLNVRSWLEFELQNRGEREGVLVGLPACEAEISDAAAATQLYLRKLAHETGMDYLTAVPECWPTGVPDSTDACRERATQVTSLLDEILHYAPQPPPAP